MKNLVIIAQLVLAFGLINVWIFRNNKNTDFRGGDAKSLKEEFKAYGLPESIYYLIGFLKLSSALLFIVGIWFPKILIFPSGILIVLMSGAIIMHLKVKDPFKRSIPALAMFFLSLFVFLNSLQLI